MTSSDEYRRLLIEAYDGERMGVVLGRELAATADDPRERVVYEAFQRVETVARDQLGPMVQAAGVTAQARDEEAITRQGVDFAADMDGQPRAEAWAAALPAFERFVGLLERLRELAPAGQQRRPYDVLVAHEVASVAMATAMVDGDIDAAHAALAGFLATV